MDVFDEMGIHGYGILLSEKDSIVYRNALAPELRSLTDPDRVHRVPDYSGANKEERDAAHPPDHRDRAGQQLQRDLRRLRLHGRGRGAGAPMEEAGLNFIGPCSRTVHGAGLKDEAKRTALEVRRVSVTPGIDNGTALTLLAKYPDVAALQRAGRGREARAGRRGLRGRQPARGQGRRGAGRRLPQGHRPVHRRGDVRHARRSASRRCTRRYPQNRMRLKAIGGGGGKGQRILASPETFEGRRSRNASPRPRHAPERCARSSPR